jgi:hypothetical protein
MVWVWPAKELPMPTPSIVGLCYQGHLPKTDMRLHQSEPESFVLELGDGSVPLTLEQLRAMPEAVAELVAYVLKRQTMAKNLLENG